MDSQLRINGLIGAAVLTGSFLNIFSNSSSKDSEKEEPDWFFIASTHNVPEEARK